MDFLRVQTVMNKRWRRKGIFWKNREQQKRKKADQKVLSWNMEEKRCRNHVRDKNNWKILEKKFDCITLTRYNATRDYIALYLIM